MSRRSSFLHRAFHDPSAREFVIVNDLLAILTLISVLALILETVPSLLKYRELFIYIEYAAVFIFTLEYLARIIANQKNVTAYLFSFFGIIDLLAVTPSLLGFTNLTFLKTARVLRLLHFLRMLRIAKLARLGSRVRDTEDYQRLYRLNIEIYFFALLSALIIFGTLIYVFEGANPSFASIPLGMLWAAKPLLGGLAQTEPGTVFGQIIAVAARFVGLILFGLIIAIVGGTVRRALFGSAEIEGVK